MRDDRPESADTSEQATLTAVIADDHALMRDGIRNLVTGIANIEIVAEADNGLEAISQVKRHQPALAFVDIKMPYANGAEVFVEIRRWSPDTKVIALTGLTSSALFRELIDAGIDGLFLKHGDAEELARAIPQIATGRKLFADAVRELVESAPEYALTRRELQVLQGISRGEKNGEIAERLHISPKTVDTHRTNLMSKLGVRSSAQLVATAVREGLVETHE